MFFQYLSAGQAHRVFQHAHDLETRVRSELTQTLAGRQCLVDQGGDIVAELSAELCSTFVEGRDEVSTDDGLGGMSECFAVDVDFDRIDAVAQALA